MFSSIPTIRPGAGITLVQTSGDAERVLDKLMSLPKHYHACDTEVANIDVTTQSPVGNGNVICATVYSGPDVDFGTGSRLWIDNMDSSQVRLLQRQLMAAH
jgi:DNA polymerase-1